MPTTFGYREDHLLTFTQYAEIMNLDIRQLYALSMVNCLPDRYRGTGCGVSWTEYDWQVVNRPSRMSLARHLGDAERRLANYTGFPVGPTYVTHEQHAVSWPISPRKSFGYRGRYGYSSSGLELEVKLNYRGIIAGGTRVLERIGENLPVERSFRETRGWGFEEDIVWRIGTPENPLILDEEQQCALCNLRIYESGVNVVNHYANAQIGPNLELCSIGPNTLSERRRFRHGHRLRPFDATYDGSTLTIVMNKSVAVALRNYSQLPVGGQGHIDDQDFCDPDIFVQEIEVYLVQYCQPAGHALLRKQPCSCPTGCDACELKKVDVCLKPGDPVTGYMKVVPIVDVGDPDDPEVCCWQETTWDSCCGTLGTGYCRTPVTVCLNYVASACGCWGDVCIPDEVCPEFASPVSWLATGYMPKVCDCGCLDDLFEHYQTDLKRIVSGSRNRIINFQDFVFGTTQGALSAYEAIKFFHNIHGNKHWFVG